MLRLLLLFVVLGGLPLSSALAQTKALDSLQNALKTAKSDTAKITLLLRLAEETQGAPATSRQHAEAAYELANARGDKARAAEALNRIAQTHNDQGNYPEARTTAQKALSLAESINDRRSIATASNQLGTADWQQGNFDAALELFFKALPIMEELGDGKGRAATLNRIGNIYTALQQYSRAREYFQRSLALAESIGDKRRQANQLNNIGDSYMQERRFDTAIMYFLRSYAINDNMQNKRVKAINLLNLGESYLAIHRFHDADTALARAYTLFQKTQSKDFLSGTLRICTELKTAQRLFPQAVSYGTRALALADSIGARPYKRDAMKALSEAYEGAGNTAKALTLYKDYILLRDSLVNDENTKRAAYRENKYAADKKDAEIKLLKKDAENQTLVRNSLLGGLGLVGALVFVLLFSNNQRKKANALLQEQAASIQEANTRLQEQNIEITASRERLEVMSEVGRSLTASLAVETIITNLYNRVAEVMDATVFGIGIIRTEKGVIENKLVMDAGKRLPLYERDMNDKNQFAVWCIDHAASVFINDVDMEGTRYIPAFREKINVVKKNDTNYAKSMLYVPLLLQESVVGIISVQSYERNAYSQGDLDTLQTLANYAAIAIANAESTEEIIRQKAIVEEFNRNIQDSIRYAKRIQDAMLPSTETLNRLLPEHFIFFRPKDVVSGDFYWCKEVHGKVFVAVVDCTGHGVPGAFMSLIGNALLNDITQRLTDLHPDLVLNELHHDLQRVLRQRETNNDDGMDICLCMIDTKTRVVEFAGAMNPLYAVVAGELREFKGTPEELGGRDERSPVYQRHSLDLSEVPEGSAMLYLTSDGYKDQYNESLQRFMPKRLRPLLTEIAAKPLAVQPQLLGSAIDVHRGDTPQVDDMLVLGVKL